MKRIVHDYKADLLRDLRDPVYAAGYISAAYSESYKTYLLALRDVAEAQKSMGQVASETRLNRENLYRMLSENGNPRQSSIYSVLHALGFEVKFVPLTPDASSSSDPQQADGSAPVGRQK